MLVLYLKGAKSGLKFQTMNIITEQFHRRSLPKGYDDETSPFFIPHPIRSFYLCVTAQEQQLLTSLARHNAVEVAALDWMESDMKGKGTVPW